MGEVSGELAGRGGAGRGPTVRLPPRRLSFAGRTVDLGEIATRLGRYPVVTLTGAGGIGKTALAVETAWIELTAGRADPARYVDLVPCRTDEQVVAALVEGVGIRGAGAAAGLDAVAEAVSGRRSLLVLDNCEHVLESARRACDQLAGRATDLRILVTSRIPLDIGSECVWRVQPMAVPGETGDGPPVLLICGTGQPADLWFAQVTDLAAAGHTVITFDNRGCGRSEAPPAPYRVADMAADTAALIEHLGLGPCDIIGYSLGGYIAQELAVTRADLVRRLVLLAGAGPAPAYAVARARAAVDLACALDPPPPSFDVADLLLSLHPMAQLQDDDDAVKITISLIEAAEPWTNPGRLGQYQADLAWLEDSSHLDRLDRIKSPCLAMAFEHDCWFPPRAVREAAERIPGCRYAELPGLGHGAPLLAAGQVNPILTEFLA